MKYLIANMNGTVLRTFDSWQEREDFIQEQKKIGPFVYRCDYLAGELED